MLLFTSRAVSGTLSKSARRRGGPSVNAANAKELIVRDLGCGEIALSHVQ